MTTDTTTIDARLRRTIDSLVAADLGDAALDVCISGLRRIEEMIVRPVKVAIAGLTASGKSSVAAVLADHHLADLGVLRQAFVPVHVRYGSVVRFDAMTETATFPLEDDAVPGHLDVRALSVSLPVPRLRGFELIDVPFSEDLERTIGQAEITIWCTRGEAPWTSDERDVWDGLPLRARRHGLLAVTHGDGLVAPAAGNAALRARLPQAFHDVVDVALSEPLAVDRALIGGDADRLAAGLATLAARVRERKGVKALRIAQRLARLTFHNLALGELASEPAERLEDWELRCARIMEQLDTGEATAVETVQTLLGEFAQFAQGEQPIAVRRSRSGRSQPGVAGNMHGAGTRFRASRRLLEFLVGDLTGLLRIELMSLTPRRPEKHGAYMAARATLLKLADLDGAFQSLGRFVREGRTGSDTVH